MATIPIPETWAVGQLVAAADLNSQIRDAVNFLLAPPLCILTMSTAYTVASGDLSVISPWNDVLVDTDGMFPTGSTSKVTAQTPGRYEMRLNVDWQYQTNPSTAEYTIGIGYNTGGNFYTGPIGRDMTLPSVNSGIGTAHLAEVDYYLNLGDYLEFFASQLTGSNVSLGTGSFHIQASTRWISRQ